MTWKEDTQAVAVNALNNFWYPVTLLFPPVPLIPLALEGVHLVQIKGILIGQVYLG